MAKFHAFYTWAYGSDRRHEVFETTNAVEEFYKKVQDNKLDSSDGYRNLVIVYGEVVEFEPVKVVDAWRVKE